MHRGLRPRDLRRSENLRFRFWRVIPAFRRGASVKESEVKTLIDWLNNPCTFTDESMAFQSDPPFAGFLRTASRSAFQAESAPAVNFLLDERVPVLREESFLAESPGAAPTGWDVGSWLGTFANHFSENIALPLRRAGRIVTFSSQNQENQLAGLESNQDVVRLESLRALHQRFPGDFDTPADLAAEIRGFIRSEQPGQTGPFSGDQRSRLEAWVDELDERRDARPTFAAPFDEVERFLMAPDWATQVRNVLGLSHFFGLPSKPLEVVLCRYNLTRVERAARKARVTAWAAIPTVLEAGGTSGPGAAFFPFPKAAAGSNPFGFGITVNLDQNGGIDFKAELLHFRLDYTINDFHMVGEITDEVTEAQLATARQRHFDLLEQDLQYRSDVPSP
jgi:hypothetical protein